VRVVLQFALQQKGRTPGPPQKFPPAVTAVVRQLKRSSLDRRPLARIKLLYLSSPFGAEPALQDTDTAVPAKNGIVVVGGADYFGLFEAAHRLFKTGQHSVSHAAGIELRLRFSLVQYPEIIKLLVSISQVAKCRLGLGVTITGIAFELISDRQA